MRWCPDDHEHAEWAGPVCAGGGGEKTCVAIGSGRLPGGASRGGPAGGTGDGEKLGRMRDVSLPAVVAWGVGFNRFAGFAAGGLASTGDIAADTSWLGMAPWPRQGWAHTPGIAEPVMWWRMGRV
jgi:hypothetical protein